MSRVLVTGGAGAVGSWIQDALIDLGHDVLSIDNLSGGFRRNFNHKAVVSTVNLCNREATEEVIMKFKPEIVYHCAANAREGASFFDPANIVYANQVTFINTIESSIKAGSLKQFIFTSSMAAYGNQTPPFTEDMALQPVDVYGISKYSIEEMTKVLAECHGFDYVIIRPHNMMGPRQSIKDKFRNVAGIFMNRIMRREDIYIYGDGKQLRQFSYIKDSLPAYIKCMDIKNETINIGGTQEITVEKLALMVIKYMTDEENYPIKYLPARYKEVKYAYCNPAKSIALLGYKDSYGIEEGIKAMSLWAKGLGSQEWTTDKLSIPIAEKMPETWR